ncbi:MAG: hypothetical protein GY707_19615, partial [Desulfobacteraceae bacterium]|nr:hypothetical protein [Desulfobacteraceae bacterium]
MTIYTFLKASLMIVVFIGLITLGAGVFKMWSAYEFSRHAIVIKGVFRGYFVQRTKSSTRNLSGAKHYSTVEEHLPMFSYVNEGVRYEKTG